MDAIGGADRHDWNAPGVLWGSLYVRDDGRIVQMSWSDASLPELLAAPETWLPPAAWADARPGGYVPGHYGFCVYDNQVDLFRVLEVVPPEARDVLAAGSNGPDAQNPGAPTGCNIQLTPEDARTVAAAFDAAGYAHEPGGHSLGFRFDIPAAGETLEVPVYFLPILPDGEVVCECG